MTTLAFHHIDGPNARRARLAAWLLAVVGAAASTGCRSEMYDQPRYEAYEKSSLFVNGSSARPLVDGVVPHNSIRAGSIKEDDYYQRGYRDGKPVDEFPFAIGEPELARGRERFNIYCAPCHGPRGDGHGMIVQRGFPAPPAFYGPITRKGPLEPTPVPTYEDLRNAPAGHFVQVMKEGHGVMYSYASRVNAEDRWKVAAYIRALQLSQYATPDVLKSLPNPTAEEQKFLQEAAQ